jgi:hypothetical protein
VTLRYKPHVTRAVDEDGTVVRGLNGACAWDIYTNPYSRKSELRRPTFRMAMKVCAALKNGVDEEDLTIRFGDMLVLLDKVLCEEEGRDWPLGNLREGRHE